MLHGRAQNAHADVSSAQVLRAACGGLRADKDCGVVAALAAALKVVGWQMVQYNQLRTDLGVMVSLVSVPPQLIKR